MNDFTAVFGQMKRVAEFRVISDSSLIFLHNKRRFNNQPLMDKNSKWYSCRIPFKLASPK